MPSLSTSVIWFQTVVSSTWQITVLLQERFKYWNHLPQQYQSHLQDHLSRICSSEKYYFIKETKEFQYNQVKLWNQNIITTDKILIPQVSLCEKIKTSGFGMAMIEMLWLSGFLLEETSKFCHKKWHLAPDWNCRSMFFWQSFSWPLSTPVEKNHKITNCVWTCIWTRSYFPTGVASWSGNKRHEFSYVAECLPKVIKMSYNGSTSKWITCWILSRVHTFFNVLS